MPAEEYFRPVSLDVFTGVLKELGAGVIRADPTLVRFEAVDWFVEICVLLEDGPNYSPRIEIGPLPERLGEPARTKIDIMHTVPDGSSLKNYNIEWRYRNHEEMKIVYTRTREEIGRAHV